MDKSQGKFYLLGAALLGLAAAFAEAVFFNPLPETSVAQVNGAVISKNEFQHVLLVVSQGRKQPLTQQEKNELLARMIDNELLLQRAEQLGLSQSHPAMRRALTQAMIEFILDNADRAEPTRADLMAFYRSNQEWFQISERLQLQRLYFSNKQKAAQAGARLKQGVAFRKIKGDEVIQPPRHPVPLETLKQYLGEDMVAAARAMQVGEVSELLATESGYFFLKLEKKLPARTPPFASIEPQVKTQYQRYQDEKILQSYIDNLRQRAKIKIEP